MASTLPTEASLTGASTTNAQQKTNFASLRNFLADLLGTDSGNKSAARVALGASAPGAMNRMIASGTFVVPDGITTLFVSGAAGGAGGGGGGGS
ncbi:MAG: hypothetical protein ACRYGK_02200, partial [Janthinobacterium lividum]